MKPTLCINKSCSKKEHCYKAQTPIGEYQPINLNNTKDNCFQMYYTRQEYYQPRTTTKDSQYGSETA